LTRALVPIPLVIAALAAMLFVANARADVDITDVSVENSYPESLFFHLEASAELPITDVTLHYRLGERTSAIGKPEDFDGGPAIETSVRVRVNAANAYIPVGTEFRYYWEIVTDDGEVVVTDEQTFLYLPPNREWMSVESDIMRVYYHGNRESLARQFLEAGGETYQQIAVDLLQTELPIVPVKVVLFATGEEMAPARQGRGGVFDEAVRTCGTKLTSDIVFVIPVSCGTSDITDTLRHEFGHIINEAAGQGSIGRLPSWIDEGTAVIAQSEPGTNFEGAFQAAVRADRLIPFNQMGTPTSDPGRVNLFYGQSWAMASYLVERGGPEQYAEFFAAMKAGERFDRALEEVYGFTLAGFEDEFREAYGLAPLAAPEATATPAQQQQQAQPTAAPTRAPISTVGQTGGGTSIDRTTIIIIGAAVLFALLGVFFYLLAAMVSANKRQQPEAAAAGTTVGAAQWRPPEYSGARDPSTRPERPDPAPAWRPPPPPERPRERRLWSDDETDEMREP
jgi:hypothetical protein